MNSAICLGQMWFPEFSDLEVIAINNKYLLLL